MMRSLTAAAAAAVTLLVAAAVASAEDAAVDVGHNKLEPATVSIAAGDKVTFTNRDQMPGGHSLVADDGSFSSPALDKGQSWSHTFERAGSYGYRIKEHPGAKGTINVK